MEKNSFHDPEGNMVIFDVATIVLAGVFGSLGAVVADSPGVGALATGVIAVTGLTLMRVEPTRRVLSDASLALTKQDEKDALDRAEASR